MADTLQGKIDQLKIGTNLYDIDLPPDATPSIASLTVSGNLSDGTNSTTIENIVTKNTVQNITAEKRILGYTSDSNDIRTGTALKFGYNYNNTFCPYGSIYGSDTGGGNDLVINADAYVILDGSNTLIKSGVTTYGSIIPIPGNTYDLGAFRINTDSDIDAKWKDLYLSGSAIVGNPTGAHSRLNSGYLSLTKGSGPDTPAYIEFKGYSGNSGTLTLRPNGNSGSSNYTINIPRKDGTLATLDSLTTTSSSSGGIPYIEASSDSNGVLILTTKYMKLQ